MCEKCLILLMNFQFLGLSIIVKIRSVGMGFCSQDGVGFCRSGGGYLGCGSGGRGGCCGGG